MDLSFALNGTSTAAMNSSPVYRRFLSDLTHPQGVIPEGLLHHDDLARLDTDRRRLIQAMEDAKRGDDGPRRLTGDEYVAARAKALRENTELPPGPVSNLEREAAVEQQQRDVQAAGTALLSLGDEICQAVRDHPEYEDQAREQVAALRAQAEELRRAAVEAERQAEEASIYVLWLSRVAADELFVISPPSGT